MQLKLYQVDAFTDTLFGGNPAAVCPLQNPLDDNLMQKIAAENNLSETAFILLNQKPYEIRWFTPKTEVRLCGHATLASAHILFNHENFTEQTISFQSKSGILKVNKIGDFLQLDFPADQLKSVNLPKEIASALNFSPLEIFKGRTDYLLIFENEAQIQQMQPDFKLLEESGARGVIVSSPGTSCDFVSRFFAPAVGINEDPVTGSAHTSLTPYWANRLKKNDLTARQISERGGKLKCTLDGDRVKIAGQAVTYLIGQIDILIN